MYSTMARSTLRLACPPETRWRRACFGSVTRAWELTKRLGEGVWQTAPADQSCMNIPFTLADAELDKAFLKEAGEQGLVTLKGHRSVGGMRASVYNAMPYEGCEKLAAFMKTFQAKNA